MRNSIVNVRALQEFFSQKLLSKKQQPRKSPTRDLRGRCLGNLTTWFQNTQLIQQNDLLGQFSRRFSRIAYWADLLGQFSRRFSRIAYWARHWADPTGSYIFVYGKATIQPPTSAS